MSLKHTSGDRAAAPTTLGDLLYADRSESPTEEEWVRLVQSVAAGDQRALRALYERTHRLVFTLAMRISNNRETAEEITLDVFHDVWRRSSKYDAKGGSVLGWIMNQARSRAIDRVRYDQRKKRVPDGPGLDDARPIQVPEPGAAMETTRRHSSLHDALTALTSGERLAIETAFFCELSYSGTAVRLGQPLGTVKTRIRSALTKLRIALVDGEGGGS